MYYEDVKAANKEFGQEISYNLSLNAAPAVVNVISSGSLALAVKTNGLTIPASVDVTEEERQDLNDLLEEYLLSYCYEMSPDDGTIVKMAICREDDYLHLTWTKNAHADELACSIGEIVICLNKTIVADLSVH